LQHSTAPVRTRNTIDILVEKFLQDLGDDIHDMLRDNLDSNNYRGLDSNRDKVAEVETAIRFFPDVLSRRKQRVSYDEEEPLYPIQCLSARNTGYYHLNLKN
jgi:hypothetical protein